MTNHEDRKADAFKRMEEEQESNVDDYWVRHLKRNNAAEMDRVVNGYPKERVLNIDVSKILNNKVWEKTIDTPGREAENIIDSLMKAVPYPKERRESHNFAKVNIRYFNVSRKKKIKELRPDDERKLISIRCIIRRVTSIRPKVIQATFSCSVGHLRTVEANIDRLPIPDRCSVRECDLRPTKHLDKLDVKVPRQWVYIQDPLEDLSDGGQPDFLKCELLEDLCGKVFAGDRAVINGKYISVPIRKGGELTTSKDVYIDVSSIEIDPRGIDEIILSKEDEEEIIKLSKSHNLYEMICDSIAPSILEMKPAKRAIALLLFEGVITTTSDGLEERGHINILIATDPGMAKTKLLKFVASLNPRNQFVVASTSTKVGLLAPLVRDEMTGMWAVEAGAYVLSNGGVLCMDEVNELSPEDFKYLNEAMENGEAHINKAGINTIVHTRASLLAACNPKAGSFDPMVALADQIKLPDTTKSRFDLMIREMDTVNEAKDRELIEHITKNRMDGIDMRGIIPPKLLGKYIAYAKRLTPKITAESKKVIDDYYVKIRKESGNTFKPTARQGTACIRLAEAHAKIRLSKTVDKEDAEIATKLFDEILKDVATDPNTNKINMGRLVHATRPTLADSVLYVIRQCLDAKGEADESKIIEEMEKRKCDKERTLRMLDELTQAKPYARIYSSKYGKWKVVM